ncbi:methyltransferase domain-containing protein [Pseudodesulfovibrio sp. JC047]|uniref:methyltransferase family protein n=1 Tax=Pseudodesulfovibrio sp. JC047 TaxID=2683199 RepID=UPI0013D30036|nr:methyltransferase dimerization domain-containing protein [Pseudodesulfovibrio sp. JC047]NDV19883.1 methyltransferase domain-containing protein [Pseudodesulfovibrio sp. JC047]
MFVKHPRANFEPINAMLMQSLASKAILSAVELHIFDWLEGTTLCVDDLADRMGLLSQRLEPLLRLLAVAGLLEEQADGYTNSPLASEFLVKDAPLYQGENIRLTMRFNAMVENEIASLMAGGEVKQASSANDWGVADNMEGTAQDAKGGALSAVVDFVADLPGFDAFDAMADVGGNHGLYTLGVLERNAAMRGVIVDKPHVVALAQTRCDQLGFGDRVTTLGMDFKTDPFVSGVFDVILTSHVLYALSDDLPGALQKIADGLKPGGWFVSHHYSGYTAPGHEMAKASLELLTRLCGYASHFIEQETLIDALNDVGFETIRCQPVVENGMGLMVAAQMKK